MRVFKILVLIEIKIIALLLEDGLFQRVNLLLLSSLSVDDIITVYVSIENASNGCTYYVLWI